MFNLNNSMRYWLYPQPTDMRKGFYTLSGLVTDQMGQSVRSGDVFIFLNRHCTSLKALHMEHGGLVIYYMKLEKGNFTLPSFDEDGRSHPFSWQKLFLLSLSNRLMMQENKESPNELLELLLEKCDRLYQENMLLKDKLEDRTDVDALKTSYEQTISKKDVLPLGCWAHARRKFEESLKNDRERAEYALEQIGLLYEVEREADDKNLSYKTAMTSITG